MKNDGFTLIEVILVLTFVLFSSSLLLIQFPKSGYQEMKVIEEMIQLAHFHSLNEYQTSEIELSKHELMINDTTYSFQNLTCTPDYFSFNPAGHIEHALTLYCQDDVNQYELIFQLGSGRSRIERY